MEKRCLVCDTTFITYPSKIKLGRGKYCSKECSLKMTNKALVENGKATRFQKGDEPHNKTGVSWAQARKDGNVYKLIHKPEHPNCSKKGYVREHRLVMEEHLGRLLQEHEVVHHKDGDTLNNDISNLELMTSEEHCRLHTPDNIHKRWETPLGTSTNG